MLNTFFKKQKIKKSNYCTFQNNHNEKLGKWEHRGLVNILGISLISVSEKSVTMEVW